MITSHILDTTKGSPASGVTVILYQGANDLWNELARSITNDDGRVTDLTQKDTALQTGIYKIRFETKDYFDKASTKTFYPYVEIVFDLRTQEHYHIPLLLNPFGYSTYRGS